jgi:hypothetical protein
MLGERRFKVGDRLAISPGFKWWDPAEYPELPECVGEVTRVADVGATIRPYRVTKGGRLLVAGSSFVISNQSEFEVLP